MNVDHESLLFYCEFDGYQRVFELRKELKEFLQLQKTDIFVAALNDKN